MPGGIAATLAVPSPGPVEASLEEGWRALGMNPLIVIPARLRSSRLPNKPLAEIHGEPMIVHVWRRAVAAGIGPVLVAAADPEIVSVIEKVGGTVVLTDPKLPTGSDRVWVAAEAVDPARDFDVIVNLQGDFPTIEPAALRTLLASLADPATDIATLSFEIHDEADLHNPNVVKVAIEPTGGEGRGPMSGRAVYFSRLPVPWNAPTHYHHVGIYAYRRHALTRFVGLAQGDLERQESLEQLRALAAGMRVDCAVIHSTPFGVDTPADLERARAAISRRN